MLVFAFLPTLAALPAWLTFELRNPLNLSDPVVLVFLPVRGAILLLHAFRAGVVPGVLAGVVDGLLVQAWARRRDEVAITGPRIGLAALGGALAALSVVVGLGLFAARGGVPSFALATVAFEIASGVVCGMVAAPGAVRLATRPDQERAA